MIMQKDNAVLVLKTVDSDMREYYNYKRKDGKWEFLFPRSGTFVFPEWDPSPDSNLGTYGYQN